MFRSNEVPFFERVEIDSVTGCWNWTGARNARGYGTIRGGGKQRSAHRVAFAIANDREREVDDLGVICHRCDNPACIRPGHLFEGTQLDNIADRGSKGRTAKGVDASIVVLTEAQVTSARERRSRGESCRSIARDLGVHHSTISNLYRMKTWKHLVQK